MAALQYYSLPFLSTDLNKFSTVLNWWVVSMDNNHYSSVYFILLIKKSNRRPISERSYSSESTNLDLTIHHSAVLNWWLLFIIHSRAKVSTNLITNRNNRIIWLNLIIFINKLYSTPFYTFWTAEWSRWLRMLKKYGIREIKILY